MHVSDTKQNIKRKNERHTGFWAFSVEWFIPGISTKRRNRINVRCQGECFKVGSLGRKTKRYAEMRPYIRTQDAECRGYNIGK